MTDIVLEQRGLPVNSSGEIIASYASGNRTISGDLAPGYYPVNLAGELLLNLPVQTPTYETDVLYINTGVAANPTDAGAMFWSDEYKTLNLNMGIAGVTAQLAQETYTLCLNNTGTTIPNGSVVCIIGSGGEHPNIGLASAATYAQAQTTIGVTTHTSNNGEHVLVTRYGLIHQLDTSALSVGAVLYLSTVAGQYTTTKPSTNNTLVRIGFCNKQHATDGEILVDPLIEVNTQGSFLECHLRAATTALPATPTAFVWPTVVNDVLTSYNATTGVFTTPFDGMYSLNLMMNPVTTGSVKQVFFAAQIWNGSTWVPSEYSTRQSAVRLSDNHQVIFVSQNYFAAGTQLRFAIWGSATGINVITETPSAGYTVIASRLLISGVKTV